MDKIRVLHCPSTVGGNPQGLARAERELGIASWAAAFMQNSFMYDTDEVIWTQGDHPLIREIKRWYVLWRAIRNYDIIHFNFGLSLMPEWIPLTNALYSTHHRLTINAYNYYTRILELRDLPLLKKLGKGIIVTYQGDDARQGDFCLKNFDINPANEVESGYYSIKSDTHKRFRIKKFAEYADRIYAVNPDLLWVLPPHAQFIPYSHIDLRDWQPVNNEILDSRVPLIVHAPSHRGVKGTHYVLDVISRLKKEGFSLALNLVEGVSHSAARRIYKKADLLIDQLLCGWYGGLAVEFMALGKPVICYIRDGDLKFIPEQMREDLPIINATPTTLYEVVREWLTVRKNELSEVGRRGRAYVEKWHDPLKIAARLKADYEAIMASKGQKKSKKREVLVE
jgi:hypothetical protein